MQKKVLESIPFDHLKTFYKYQWFRCNVDCNFNEYDTLLVIPQSKLIINIEVKRGSTLSVLKKAADQTRKHRNFFSSLFGPMLSEKWKFVKAACMPHIDFGSIMNSPCSYCKQFIVRESNLNNMRQWISTLTDNEPETNVDEYQTEYENLLVALIGLSSLKHSNQQNSLVVDPLELSKQTENKITGRNLGIDGESEHDRENLEKAVDGTKTDFDNLCYMLTPSQLNAVKNLSNFFIIDGDMGTGKTYVLKERVKRCANKFPTDTILYVDLSSTDIWTNKYAYEAFYNFYGLKPTQVEECDESKEDFDHRFYEFQPTGEMEDQKTLMTMIAEIDFESNKKIKVVTAREIQLNYDLRYKARHLKEGRRVPFTWMLKDYLSRIKFDHVFIDEMRMQNEIIDFFSTGAKSYCVVLKSYTNHQVKIKKSYKDNLVWFDTRLEFNKYIKWTRIMKRKYGAVRISFEKNMRNSENVLHLASSLTPAGFDFIDNSGSLVSPTKNVFGPSCYHYENTQWLDPGLLVRAILKKYFADRPREVIVVLTENLDDVEEDREVYQYLQKYNSEGRNIVLLPSTKQPTDQDVEKNIKNFIRNSEGILVTSLKQFHGAQARNLVLFAGMSLNNSKLRDAILRAMSFAIVIHVEHIKRPNLWVFEDTNLHDFIDYTEIEEYRRNINQHTTKYANAYLKTLAKESPNAYYTL